MPSPWWSSYLHTDRRPALLERGRIKSAIRCHFEREGFVEVECAALQVSPGNEAHLHAFETAFVGTRGVKFVLPRIYNQPDPITGIRPNPALGQSRYWDNSDSSTFTSWATIPINP